MSIINKNTVDPVTPAEIGVPVACKSDLRFLITTCAQDRLGDSTKPSIGQNYCWRKEPLVSSLLPPAT